MTLFSKWRGILTPRLRISIYGIIIKDNINLITPHPEGIAK
jgi:hypothetical protein